MGHFVTSMRRILTSWRRLITENLGVIVAIAAAAIALWSAKIQRDALQLDQRPYLKVTFESIKADKNPQNNKTVMDLNPSGWEGYDAYATLEVTGKTPAFNVDARGSCVPTHFLDRQDTDNGLTWRLAPFLFDEKQILHCHVQHDLPDGRLPFNVPFNLTVKYDDVFGHHHLTTFCEIIITGHGEAAPPTGAFGTVECDGFKFQMN
jgi:hypothetical protein